VDDARHQITGPLRLIKRQRQFFQMSEYIVAQIVFDVAPGVENERAREGPDKSLRHRGADNQQRVERHILKRAAALDDPDRFANPTGAPHNQRRRAQKAQPAEKISSPVTPDVLGDAPHVALLEYSTVLRVATNGCRRGARTNVA